MATLYGIKHCDSVKKARAWLDKRKIKYNFHDFQIDGIDEKMVQQFVEVLGWETVLNSESTTYRQLPEWQQDNMTEELALELMLQQPTIIKRPVLKKGKDWEIGFSEENYQRLFD